MIDPTDSLYAQRTAEAKAFHEQHPEVWELFVMKALKHSDAGRKVGAKLLLEEVRRETGIQINNNWFSLYARRFNRLCVSGYFKERGLPSLSKRAKSVEVGVSYEPKQESLRL